LSIRPAPMNAGLSDPAGCSASRLKLHCPCPKKIPCPILRVLCEGWETSVLNIPPANSPRSWVGTSLPAPQILP
jgi:hypothetical protein